MALLAGCYERFLFGYNLNSKAEQDVAQPGLARSFTHAAHKGVVKCVAAAGQYAASGGADDTIHLYDLKGDNDLGFLMSPGEGAVTALAFFTPAAAYNPTHLLSGSADGSISVWQAGGGWECMKTMRGHRKEVASISVHPSGLLALTVSRDGTLRMWDLVKGRCTYTAKLEGEAEGVAFCAEDGGALYAVHAGARVTTHSVAGDPAALRTLDHPRRVLCVAWAPAGRLLTGAEDGSLRLWDARAGVELLSVPRAHASRLRDLALLPPASSNGRLLVATASSDGSLKAWDLGKAAEASLPGEGEAVCLGEANTRARLTCLAAADAPGAMRRQLAAAAAAAQQQRGGQQQQQQQQQQQRQGGKRKASAASAASEPGKKPKKAAGAGPKRPDGARKEPLQPVGGGSALAPGRKARGKGEAAGPAAAAAGDSVVVHDGVVEFLDSPAQQQKQKKKLKDVAARSKAAAEHGKRFRSLPGQARGGGGGGGKPRKPRS